MSATIGGVSVDVLADVGLTAPFILNRDYLDIEGMCELTPQLDAMAELTNDTISVEGVWGSGEWAGPLTQPDAGSLSIELYDPARYYDPSVGIQYGDSVGGGAHFYDGFDRTVSAGWGNGWEAFNSGAAASDVRGTYGLTNVSAASGSSQATLTRGMVARDCDILGEFWLNNLPDTGVVQLTINARGDNEVYPTPSYMMLWQTDLGGNHSVQLYEIGGVHFLANSGALSPKYTQGARLRFRFRCVGSYPTMLYAKVWPAAEVEPPAWSVVASSSFGALQSKIGHMGVREWVQSAPEYIGVGWEFIQVAYAYHKTTLIPPTPGRAVQIQVDGQPVWTGVTSDIRHDMETGISTIEAIDAIAEASRIGVNTPLFKGWIAYQLNSLRLGAGWPTKRWLVEGPMTTQRDAENVTGSFLEGLKVLMTAELGDLWCDRDGRIRVRLRGVSPPEAATIELGPGGSPGIVAMGNVIDRRIVNAVYLDPEDDAELGRQWKDDVSVLALGEAKFESSEDELKLIEPV